MASTSTFHRRSGASIDRHRRMPIAGRREAAQ
jgi:hypothetical protein